MAYSKQTWTDGADGGTPVSAARLTHLEDGIGDLDTGLVERVQDIIGAALIAGTNVDSITYNDAAGTVTINAATQAGGGGGLTTEQVQDLVATMVVAGTNVTATYDDTAGTLTLAAAGGGGGGGSVQDTGVRNVLTTWLSPTGSLTDDGSPNTFHVSRVGSQVTVVYDAAISSNGINLTVPAGFRPTSRVAGAMNPTANDYINQSARVNADGTGLVGWNGRRLFTMTWTTTDAWPSSLPGTAV